MATSHRILSSHSLTSGCPVFRGGERTGARPTPLALLLDPKARLDPFILWRAPALAIGLSSLKSPHKRVRDPRAVPGLPHALSPGAVDAPTLRQTDALRAPEALGKTQPEPHGPRPRCNCAENDSQMTQTGSYVF